MSKYYILPSHFALRGWLDAEHALQDRRSGQMFPLPQSAFDAILLSSNGISVDSMLMPPAYAQSLEVLAKRDCGSFAASPAELQADQRYRKAPCLHVQTIHWSITGRCNMRCKHCYLEAPDALYGELPLAQCVQLMDQMVSAGISTVSLTGGEPLVRPDWQEFCQALKERNIFVESLYTNGFAVTEKWLDQFEDFGFGKIHFSLSFDGIGCHDWVRGREGMEKRTIEAIGLLVQRGYPVSIETALYKDSLHAMPDTCQLLADLGISAWKISGMSPSGAWLKYVEKTASDEELYHCFLAILEKFTSLRRPFSLQMNQCYHYSSEIGKATAGFCVGNDCQDSLKQPVCGCIRMHPYLLPNGTLMPCMPLSNCGLDKKMPNLLETPLTEVLQEDSPLFRLTALTAESMFQKYPSKCSECSHRFQCRGGCRAQAYLENGNIYGPNKSICEYFEKGYDKLFEPYWDK